MWTTGTYQKKLSTIKTSPGSTGIGRHVGARSGSGAGEIWEKGYQRRTGFSGTSAVKAVLTEGDSVSDAVTDIVSLVTTHRQNDTTLTVPCGNVCEHIEPKKSAKKEEVEVKRPTPFSQDWVVRQVMTEAQDGKVKVHHVNG